MPYDKLPSADQTVGWAVAAATQCRRFQTALDDAGKPAVPAQSDETNSRVGCHGGKASLTLRA